MNIDNLISSSDFERSEKDCILHRMLKIYIDKKSDLASSDDSTAIFLKQQLAGYSNVLKPLLNHVKCFPTLCANCEGLAKCIECIIKDNCVDAQLEFYKLNQLTVSPLTKSLPSLPETAPGDSIENEGDHYAAQK